MAARHGDQAFVFAILIAAGCGSAALAPGFDGGLGGRGGAQAGQGGMAGGATAAGGGGVGGMWLPIDVGPCGNGLLQPELGEMCDDGNRARGDGCTHLCQLEVAWRCPEPGRPCASTCGNGAVDNHEMCDDGNTAAGDGCDPYCADGDARAADPQCGDGLLQPTLGEECDLGAAMNTGRYGTHGCTPTCRKPHYCGDALVDVAMREACDLGANNGMPGQPCPADCGILLP
jgi:cysteine-rich repeat protein